MSLFVVDEEKCSRCGACVVECPAGIIKINYPNPVPTPVEGAEERCINCGHCVVVCRHSALSHRAMMPDQCPPVRTEWLQHPEMVEHYMRARRSIREYKEGPVDREVLAKLIDIARFAPTASNRQPVRWLVIHDRDKTHQLAELVIGWFRHMAEQNPGGPSGLVDRWDAGMDFICRGAPHVIVAYSPEENSIARTDCAIALTHLELAATAFGVGVCWAGFIMGAASAWPPVREFLDLPEGNVSNGMLLAGYPKHKYHRLPIRNEPQIIWR